MNDDLLSVEAALDNRLWLDYYLKMNRNQAQPTNSWWVIKCEWFHFLIVVRWERLINLMRSRENDAFAGFVLPIQTKGQKDKMHKLVNYQKLIVGQ